MRYSAGILLLIGLLLASSPAAGFTPDSDVREWFAVVHTESGAGQLGGRTDTFTVTTPHGFDTSTRHSILDITINTRLESGVGTREREYTFETDLGHACTWRLAIGTSFEASNPYFQVPCNSREIPDGPFTWWLNQTNIAGGEPVQQFYLAIELRQTDEVQSMTAFEDMTGLTAFEFTLFPLLAFVGLFLWTRPDLGVRLFGIFLVLFDLALVFSFYASAAGQAWEGLLVMVFVLLLATAWMVIQLARDIGRERREAV